MVEDTKQSSSGLDYRLHPLVVINITDHYNRTRANSSDGASTSGSGAGPVRVLGCLLGSQSGRVVDISNSFEIKYMSMDGVPVIDEEFLSRKANQYKQVFKDLEIVGWYATGAEIVSTDLETHRKILELTETPAFLLLDPCIQYARRDLPVSLYETELHMLNGAPELMFVSSPYTLQTSEAERIGVDQVSKILPAGKASVTSQLTVHFASLHSASKMLASRVEVLLTVVTGMADGSIPVDHAVLRMVNSLLHSLPALDAAVLNAELEGEHADATVVLLLASLTKSNVALTDLLDKYSLAYEKPKRGRPSMPASAW